MSFGDIVSNGGMVAVIGLGTVFAVLAILWGVLELMRVLFAPKDKKENKAEEASAQPTAPAIVQPAQAAPSEDEEELIAVLTAAVAASLNTSTYRLKIRSYRQINTGTPVWNTASRRENLH